MRAASAVVVALALAGCSERWDGFAYPNRFNLASHRDVGSFVSLDDCRTAALNMLRALGSDTFRGDYECGLNCEPSGVGNVCEATER
jgi:hypothetical protein